MAEPHEWSGEKVQRHKHRFVELLCGNGSCAPGQICSLVHSLRTAPTCGSPSTTKQSSSTGQSTAASTLPGGTCPSPTQRWCAWVSYLELFLMPTTKPDCVTPEKPQTVAFSALQEVRPVETCGSETQSHLPTGAQHRPDTVLLKPRPCSSPHTRVPLCRPKLPLETRSALSRAGFQGEPPRPSPEFIPALKFCFGSLGSHLHRVREDDFVLR